MLHAVEGASGNEATREAISLAPAFRQVISRQSPTGLKAGANEMVVQLFKEE